MARLVRAEASVAEEVPIVHVQNRTVRIISSQPGTNYTFAFVQRFPLHLAFHPSKL